jgi:glycosyltransferase involved in cell wall biosynthesis
MPSDVSVAIPVLDGGPLLEQVLEAVAAQRYPGSVETVVCDSGSRDGSDRRAAALGAQVMRIAPGTFGHGRTRNALMERCSGAHVAFLTQDAVPADREWLARLVGGFACAPDVSLAYGPYRPRADASPMVTRELQAWFGSLGEGGGPRVDRLAPSERAMPARVLLGRRGYFTDANGCVARAAWAEIPFRDVGYAEDHLLAQDMLRAGYAKVFVPDAAVVHSHDYSAAQWLRRSFDESRAMHEIYGASPAGDLASSVRNLRGNVGADLRWSAGGTAAERATLAGRSLVHHGARTLGAVLGERAQSLPARVRAQLSLERRR